ncbi:stimulator of interferon genes protein-like isoform X2 [Stylophora pistillata]|uniref:stimulator of interferon genes protein-like isoform X2 n=1 Tax=Stylophora pistillata TaxID=50429 RepID=UPI000C03FD70|nr:stimulator of interferon genes protein-like isoform X2 [Stylophora pistillata]
MMSNDSQSEKRTAKWTGSGTPIAEGEESSSPSAHQTRQKATAADDDDDQQITDLEQELAELDLEEQRKAKKKRIASLQRQIEEKRNKLATEISDLNEKENKNVVNVADGLAWSYYSGYLKLVLPRLEQRISESEKFRHKITDKKLYILLPKSCFTCDDIEHADSRVKWAGNLPESKINRGGIKERSYKHAVHEIVMPPFPDGTGEKYHFIVEYATPLMTLYDMSKFADAQLTDPERDHQVLLFMQKLTELLEKSKDCKGQYDCRGKYELVSFDEEEDKIADILIARHNNANKVGEESEELSIPVQ